MARTSNAAAPSWSASPLKQENQFRPNLHDVENFVKTTPRAKAIFLNSPHNPTGGVATESDLKAIADLVRGKNIAVFSDEPYNHMVWAGKHHPLLAQPGIIDQAVACYTFSKSYSMSGWRLGYAVSSPRIIDTIGKMINTSLSCVPPIVQLAGEAALKNDAAERDEVMQRFKKKVELLVQRVEDGGGRHGHHAGRHVLRLPERRPDLHAAGHHLARPGDVPARSRRRRDGRGLPGRRMLRPRGQGLPALQLRGAGRSLDGGGGVLEGGGRSAPSGCSGIWQTHPKYRLQ